MFYRPYDFDLINVDGTTCQEVAVFFMINYLSELLFLRAISKSLKVYFKSSSYGLFLLVFLFLLPFLLLFFPPLVLIPGQITIFLFSFMCTLFFVPIPKYFFSLLKYLFILNIMSPKKAAGPFLRNKKIGNCFNTKII